MKYRAGTVGLAVNYYRRALARGCESQSRAQSLFLPLARKRMFRVKRFPHRARPPAGFRIRKYDPRTHRHVDAPFDYRDSDSRRIASFGNAGWIAPPITLLTGRRAWENEAATRSPLAPFEISDATSGRNTTARRWRANVDRRVICTRRGDSCKAGTRRRIIMYIWRQRSVRLVCRSTRP